MTLSKNTPANLPFCAWMVPDQSWCGLGTSKQWLWSGLVKQKSGDTWVNGVGTPAMSCQSNTYSKKTDDETSNCAWSCGCAGSYPVHWNQLHQEYKVPRGQHLGKAWDSKIERVGWIEPQNIQNVFKRIRLVTTVFRFIKCRCVWFLRLSFRNRPHKSHVWWFNFPTDPKITLMSPVWVIIQPS